MLIHTFPYIFSGDDDCDIEQIDPKKNDPEYFVFDCFNTEEVEKLLNETVESLSNQLQITPSLAKVLLHQNKWNANEVIEKYRNNATGLLVNYFFLFINKKFKILQEKKICL